MADVKRCFRDEHTWGTVFEALMYRGRQLNNAERIHDLGLELGESVTMVCSEAVYEVADKEDFEWQDLDPYLGDAGVDGYVRAVFDSRWTTVESSAFENCRYLAEVQLPRTVRVIDNNAFAGCDALARVNLQDSALELVRMDAFRGCISLRSIVFPETLREIDTRAFAFCYNLKEVHLPSSSRLIGTRAFYGCQALESVTLPLRVEVMREAFCVSFDDRPLRVFACGQIRPMP